MERNTVALQAARNWSLVSFERVRKGPVFFISAHANACAFCTWTNIYVVIENLAENTFCSTIVHSEPPCYCELCIPWSGT